MAKKITMCVLLVLIIGGSILQHVYVTGATEKLKSDLNQVYDALHADEFEKALTAAQTFSENWGNEKNLYETLFKHEEVDLISSSAARLNELVAQANKSEALAVAAETLYYIHHIHDIDSVSFENIF
jgi:hypothetical protein